MGHCEDKKSCNTTKLKLVGRQFSNNSMWGWNIISCYIISFSLTATLQFWQRRWLCQVHPYWRRCRDYIYHWRHHWWHPLNKKPRQRTEDPLCASCPGYRQTNKQASWTWIWVHNQSTGHQWQCAKVHRRTIHCHCAWNVRYG